MALDDFTNERCQNDTMDFYCWVMPLTGPNGVVRLSRPFKKLETMEFSSVDIFKNGIECVDFTQFLRRCL